VGPGLIHGAEKALLSAPIVCLIVREQFGTTKSL
jgi:hypothetical protein